MRPQSGWRVAVTGASGMVGSALVAALLSEGHRVQSLVRRAPRRPDEVEWHPERGLARPSDLEGCDALVALQGSNIAGGRWTEARKKELVSSRVDALLNLADSLRSLERGPRVLVSASGIGIYGVRPCGQVDEQARQGEGFLAELAAAWEGAAGKLGAALGARVVVLRLGVVLSPRGGALAKMLPIYRLGLGGVLAGGRSMMSWIALDDVVEAIRYLLLDGNEGAFNVVAPEPVSQKQFTEILGRVLRRPTPFPVPAVVLRALLGEMAQETILASQYALPERLLNSGFRFRYPDLESALRHVLGR